jgi:hypothetical protein
LPGSRWGRPRPGRAVMPAWGRIGTATVAGDAATPSKGREAAT